MANVKINDLTSKSSPVSTDQFEIQETAGGTSYKVTLGAMFGALINARGRSNAAGTLATGSYGITSVSKGGTGIYNYTLTSAVTSVSTAQLFACTTTEGAEVSATMTTTTNCQVRTTVAGTLTDCDNSILVLKEG